MARPRKEGMEYFPHDTDATDDEKVDAMRALFGNDGYAFYFILCERIYRTSDAELDISKSVLLTPIIKKLLVTPEKFSEMLEAAFELDLFDQIAHSNRQVITSNGIKKRSEQVGQMRDRWRKRKENSPVREVIPLENGGDNQVENEEETPESKAKESKAKESKAKESKEELSSYGHSPVNCFGMYEREIGEITQSVSDKLIDLEDFYSEEWLKKAIEVAVFAEEKKLRYIEGTLKNWKLLNHPEPWTVEKPAAQNQKSNVTQFQRYGKAQKPQLPIVSESRQPNSKTPEERAAMRQLVAEMGQPPKEVIR